MADIFSLERLPPKFLKHVLRDAIPQRLTFKFLKYGLDVDGQPEWSVHARPIDSDEDLSLVRRVPPPPKFADWTHGSSITTSRKGTRPALLARKNTNFKNSAELPRDFSSTFVALCGVSKHIGNEARVVLFENNEFTFSVSAQSHVPHSLPSAQIFGPLGAQHRTYLLRDLRCVRLVLDIDDGGYWVVVRHRSPMEHFVKIIHEHAEDENKSCYLKSLTVCIIRNGKVYPFDLLVAKARRQSFSGTCVQWYMFALESLVGLHTIEDFTVSGVPEWFTKCLRCA